MFLIFPYKGIFETQKLPGGIFLLRAVIKYLWCGSVLTNFSNKSEQKHWAPDTYHTKNGFAITFMSITYNWLKTGFPKE